MVNVELKGGKDDIRTNYGYTHNFECV